MALKNSNLFKLENNLLGRRKASRLAASESGFTIVELLIVIVVIAILAAITIVAYNGISSQAKESALKSDLTTAAKKLHVEKVGTDSFPSSKPGYISSDLDYSGTSSTFCVTGKAGTKDFFIDEVGNVSEGGCPPPSIQSFTPAQCAALPVFDGTNTSAIRQVTDTRGGTTRTYEIAKLADDKCWMLNNLKLGSTTSTTTLTSADSNVASNFTLPRLYGGTSGTELQYDTPKAYGPVPGDTGSGATNYGYLYNWPAATAGESRTSHPPTAGNAPNSICPANWRLPTGSATGEFAWLNAKMNNPGATGPSTATGTGYYQSWQSAGLFRGSFTGYWYSGFTSQGVSGKLWSASAHPSLPNRAFDANFSPNSVKPGDGSFGYRQDGYGVRCLLN